MKKYLITGILFLLPTITFGEDRGRYARIFSSDTTEQSIRTQTMELFVERQLFSTSSPLFMGRGWFSWVDIRKEDFSEKAKATLLRHLTDRTLSDNGIEQIRSSTRESMLANSTLLKNLQQRAERADIDFDVFFEQTLNERADGAIERTQRSAIEFVPAIIPLLLGWLEYEPAIPVLNAILTDKIPNTNYALHNRGIFARNVRLALARMGNKEIEQEFLQKFLNADVSGGRDQYLSLLKQMYYINSRTAINAVIESIKNELLFIEVMPAIAGEVVHSSRNWILLTLYYVILDYPLKFERPFHQEHLDSQPSRPTFVNMAFYRAQYPFLEQWLKENRETFQIDRERFIIIRD